MKKEGVDNNIATQKTNKTGPKSKEVSSSNTIKPNEESVAAVEKTGKKSNHKKKSVIQDECLTEPEPKEKKKKDMLVKKLKSSSSTKTKNSNKAVVVENTQEENKENVSPIISNKQTVAVSKRKVSKLPASDIAAAATKEVSNTTTENNDKNQAGSSSSKRNKDQKKVATATATEEIKPQKREPLAEVKIENNMPKKELEKQGDYEIDYQSLREALRETLSLEDRIGPIYFAPLPASSGRFENSFPQIGKSFSTSTFSSPVPVGSTSSRTQNQSRPSAKNRHAEIPPPTSLTTERLGNKKNSGSAKSESDYKTTIDHIKERKVKPKSTTVEDTRETIDTIETMEKKVQPTTKADKKTGKVAKEIGEPVEPIVFMTEKCHSTTTVGSSKKEGNEKTKGGYCHPNDFTIGKNRVRFERYLDPEVCKEKVKQGTLHQGVVRINKRTRTDAYVTCESLDSDIFINGTHDRNRALEGDTVFVELLDLETVWAKKKASVVKKREERHSTAAERPPQDEDEEDKAKPKYVGKVVSILATGKDKTYSGTLSIHRSGPESSNSDTTDVNNRNNNEGVRLVWFKPVDGRNPLIAIQLRFAPDDILKNEEKYRSLLMVAKINRWPADSLQPFGTVLRELGHIGNIAAETQAVLMDNNIVEQDFGKKALNGLPKLPWSIQKADIKKRRDLRETRIFTIDPATAKDLDDAVHVTKLSDDEYEVGVHIADVSHFINQHTALDSEAFDRGTSTYLCDRVIPMLPSLLCEQLCSLNPSVERLAFSVIWKMDSAGNIKDTWFGKSVIKSCAKLAYEDAQSVIEGRGLPKTVTVKGFKVAKVEQDIMHLFMLSKQMRERRFANGALSINSIHLSFELNQLGEPCKVSVYEQKDANKLIEEFMLRANMSVAEKISKHYPNEALLRQHSPPHEKSLNEFIKIAENLGYDFDGSSAGSLQESFNKIDNENVKSVLRLLAVKPMQRAKYFCAGSCEATKFKHYALNVPLYTHFTSPIRRFADIVVHRQLEAALANKNACGYKKDAVTKAADHCNERKEKAKNSQDSNIQLYLAHYLHMVEEQTKNPVMSEAIVTHVLKDCFDVLVPEYGIEKRVHIDALPVKKFVYDPRKIALSVYWKEGVEATKEFDMGRKLNEHYLEPSGTQLYLDVDSSAASKTMKNIPKELVGEKLIDNATKMQRFEAFSKLTVRIQVNVERSPPIVSIYPVNPFISK